MTNGPERPPVDNDLLHVLVTAAYMRIGAGAEELVEELMRFWEHLWADVAPAIDARLREDDIRHFLEYAAVVLLCSDRSEGASQIAAALPEIAIRDHFSGTAAIKIGFVHRFGAGRAAIDDRYPIDLLVRSGFNGYVADLGVVPPGLLSVVIDAELPEASTEALASIQWREFSTEIWETWWENSSETFEYRVDLLRRRLCGLVAELAAPADNDDFD